MNKFSKITGLIAFWAKVVTFLSTILIIIFQKSLISWAQTVTKDVTVFPFGEIFNQFILLLITGLFCFNKKTDNRTRAILCLYFYILVVTLFSNPLTIQISAIIDGARSLDYLAMKSLFFSNLHSFTYIFTTVGIVCFYLSVGSFIVLDNNENKEAETEASEKSRTKLILYSCFLGIFGVDRFYAKRTKTGFLKLMCLLPILTAILFTLISSIFPDFPKILSNFINSSTSITLDKNHLFLILFFIFAILYLPAMIFSVYDFVICVLGKMKDSENKPITKW